MHAVSLWVMTGGWGFRAVKFVAVVAAATGLLAGARALDRGLRRLGKR
ncbi:MAG: hypothetical protein K6U14_10950 [Firmicutes bacterium]|nr:hypothetical protein [Alicyclobacillaceae bacterium]MCL6498129.1 hypothetical protein [Bacillota bacterium]